MLPDFRERTTFIGVGSRARSGKDSVAQFIHEAYPKLTKVYHWADALKYICHVDYGMTVKDGPLLQRIGTDQYRAEDPDVWVNALMWFVYNEAPPIALVPDTRFQNEIDAVHAAGGYVIKTTRMNPDGTVYVATDRDPNHPSECSLDSYEGWDKRIVAVSGDMDGLKQQALQAFEDLVCGGLSE